MQDERATAPPPWTALLLVFLTVALACPALASVPHEVAIAKGIELINAGRWRDALVPLEEALAAAPGNAEALFYAGVARSRLADYAEAESLLRRALAADETAEVQHELGRVAALTGRCGDADGLFTRAAALGADEAARHAAGELLDGCRGKGAAHPWRLSLSVGWQHDTNVVLDPDRPVKPRPGGKADDRALAYLTAGATVLKGNAGELALGYAFYGSAHKDLTDYNAIYHKLSVPATFVGPGPLRPALTYTLEDTSFGGHHYSQVHTAAGVLGLAEGSGAATEAVAERRWSTFWDSALFADNTGRGGTGWSAGLRQRAALGPVRGEAHGLYDREDADERHWAYTGARLGASLDWRLLDALTLGLGGEYQPRDYREAAPGAAKAREDRFWQWTGTLAWTISRHFSAAVTATRSVNDSNIDAYAYHRTVYGIVLSAGI